MPRSRRTARTKDPLGPVESVVSVSVVFVTLLIVVFGLIGVAQLAVSGSSDIVFLGLGDDEACGVLDPSGGGTYSSSSDDGGGQAEPSVGISDFREDVARYQPDGYEVCLTDPTIGQQVAGSAGDLARLGGFYAVSLVLLATIRAARRHGLFVPETATRVRRLGQVLLVVALVVPLVRSVADGIVVAAAVDGRDWYADIDRLGFSWSLLVTALGVITVSRVLGRAVELQEDVDATI